MLYPPEKENFKFGGPTFLSMLRNPHLRGNNLVHRVVDLQVKDMRSAAPAATGVNTDS